MVDHTFDGKVVRQRKSDGYMDATQMCKASGKTFHDYSRQDGSREYINQVSVETGIPVSTLVQVTRGKNRQQGTWVHRLRSGFITG